MFRPSWDRFFVHKVRIEQQHVVVGSKRLFTIFTTGKETNTVSEMLTETFHEELQITFNESVAGRQMLIVIRESEEGRGRVHTLFMHAPESPLARMFELTADTLATWNFDRDPSFRFTRVKYEPGFPGLAFGIVSREGTVTGH